MWSMGQQHEGGGSAVRKKGVKVSVVCLNNLTDGKGNLIGHYKKQVEQTLQVLLGIGYRPDQIEVVAGEKLLETVACGRKVCLPFHVSEERGTAKTIEAQMAANYFYACLRASGDYIWYIYVSEIVLRLISLFPMKRKLIATTYMNWEGVLRDAGHSGGMRRRQIEKGLDRLYLCITTNPSYRRKQRAVFLPDYFRTDQEKELYYRPKVDRVTSVGLITKGKNLTNVIKVFARHDMGIPLVIKGRIRDQVISRSQIAQYNRRGNIQIADGFLPEEEYRNLLAESRFVILNCDPKIYKNRTSGVLLESIFVGCIPIAPAAILRSNHVNGIAYTNIGQIPELLKAYMEGGETIRNDLGIYELEQFVKVLSPYFLR